MFNQTPDLPPTKKLLHYVCFFCLVGWGASAAVVASHVDSMAPWFEWTRQLAMLCFFALLTFGFFYIEYVAVERLAGRELNETLGHLQAAGGTALLLAGVVIDVAALISNDSQFFGLNGVGDTLLALIAILGEGVFLANIVVTYVLANQTAAPAQQVILISRPAPPAKPPAGTPIGTAQKIAERFDWSSSPTVIFGTAAAFFVLAGIFLIVKSPARMPLERNGALTYVSPGYLWLPLAIPFAVFAVIYWLIEIFTARTFDRSATRMHFLCTILAVLDATRIYWSWSVTTSNLSSQPPGILDFFGVLAFLALAAGALVWNISASSARTARTAQGSPAS
jgi:hypothetical protein